MVKQSNRLNRTNNHNLLCHSSGILKVQNQVVGRAMLSLQALGGSFLAASQLLVGTTNPWCSLACKCITLVSATVNDVLPLYLCVLGFPSCKSTRHWIKYHYLHPQLEVISPAKILFPNKVTLTCLFTHMDINFRWTQLCTGSLEDTLLHILNPFKLNVVQINTQTEMVTVTSQALSVSQLCSFNKCLEFVRCHGQKWTLGRQ